MAGAPVQSKFTTGTAGTGTVAITLPVAVTAGNRIAVFVWDKTNQSRTFSCSDGVNTYVAAPSPHNDALTATTICGFLSGSTASGSTTVTVTATNGATDQLAGVAIEMSGLSTSASPVSIANGAQAHPGTGADAITTGTITTSVTSFLIGIASYAAITGSDSIAHGTGFTSTSSANLAVSGWSGLGLGSTPCVLEWQSGVVAGTPAITFTDATLGGTTGNDYITVGMAVQESGGGGPVGTIAIVQSLGNENAGSTGGSVVMTQAPTVGQPIVVCVPYTNPGNVSSVTDNVGNTYNLIDAWTVGPSGTSMYWAVAKSASIPTVTIAMNGSHAWKMEVTILGGFQGTPTLDPNIVHWSSPSGTTVNFSPLTTNFANEILFMGGSSNFDIQDFNGPAPWITTAIGTAFNSDSFYVIANSASGTSVPFVSTLPSAATYFGQQIGIYDSFGQSTPTFLTAASTITTSGFTAGSWNTVSLSGVVPSGSKGVILNLSSTSGGAILGLGLRPTGSTDTWQQATNAGTNNSSQQYRHVGLNGSLQFDCYPTTGTNFANSTVEVVGYYGAEAVFLNAAIQLTTAGTSSYNTYNAVTAGVPSGAVGVILGFNERVSQTFGVRQNGSSDDFSIYGAGSNNNGEVIVGIDGSGNFQLRTNVGGLTPFIVGYFPSNSQFVWNRNAILTTPSTAGSAQPLNPEKGAIAYLYQVANGVTYTIGASGTTGLPAQAGTAGSMAQAMSGPSPTANLPALTNATIWELGFFGPLPVRNNTTVYYRPATQFVDESVIQN